MNQLNELVDQFAQETGLKGSNAVSILKGAITPTRQDAVCHTGVVSLDAYIGALPTGVIEIYGEPNVGKTALLGRILAEGQKSNMKTGLVATEYLDTNYLSNLGVDLNRLAIFPAHSLMVTECLSEPGVMMAIDSLTAFRPEVEDINEWERAITAFITSLQPKIAAGSCLVFTNHVRAHKVHNGFRGVESAARNILDLMDCRFEISREEVRENTYTMVVNIVANQLAKPGSWVKLPCTKGKGIDVLADLLDFAVRRGLVQLRGATYWFEGQRLGVGRENVTTRLQGDQALRKHLYERCCN